MMQKESFSIIGIGIHTSNQTAMEELPELWEKFNIEDIKNKIPNRINDDLLAVYTDYEGDYTKPYLYILGCEVSSVEIVPEGMIAKKIPSAKYEIFTPNGKIPEIVVETWQQIWTPQIDVQRTYAADFEVYKISGNSQNPEVQIYIGIK